MKKLLKSNSKAIKYKRINNILIVIGVIFFITSIAAKINTVVKSLSEKETHNSTEFNWSFSQTHTLIYDGLIGINEALLDYSVEIDKLENKKLPAERILENEKKELINSLKFKKIESTKKEVDKHINNLKANSNNDYKLKLLFQFYKEYCEYYDSLINIEGNCDEYIMKLRVIEKRAIEAGYKISKF